MERDILVVLTALGALAKRLTGEDLLVREVLGEDEYIWWNIGLSANTRWERHSPETSRGPENIGGALRACLEEIRSAITHGPVPGNGCDQVAERNGLVLAQNIVMQHLEQRGWKEHE